MACLVAFIYVTFLLANIHLVHGASGTITTDRAIYPIWGIGGTVLVSAQNLAPNTTYYLWIQRPRTLFPIFVETPFTGVNGSTQAPIPVGISPKDPSGTYTLSLSTSGTADTMEAVSHFGVLGTDSRIYERTKMVTIAGGGFAENSSISLNIAAGNRTLPGFPVNVTARENGEFDYTFELPPTSAIGTLNATTTGLTLDKHQTETANSLFIVTPTTIRVQALKAPAAQIERTMEVNATYKLTYPDGRPVIAANATIDVVSVGHTVTSVPMVLVNSTSGEWRAAWSPPPSANIARYHFQFNSANFTDAYGNTGKGSPASSPDFRVISARLQLVIQTNLTMQRTQESNATITVKYPSGANLANVTQANIVLAESNGRQSKLVTSVNGTQVFTRFKIPVNATLGSWTLSYSIQDPWGNSGSDKVTISVQPASPTFRLQTPATTERTTFLNVTNSVYYPDGTLFNSTVTLSISHGNQTWTPTLNLNSTTAIWSASYYVVQNATLGPYDITWAVRDSYGNAGNNTSTTIVIPARFRFLLQSNNATVNSFNNLDLPVTVRYPNGTSLTNIVGSVTANYKNATGDIITLPLAYNQTNATWHMFFSTPEEGNVTFSFGANDRFGNSGLATDAFILKINPSSRVASLRLIIAGVIGALIPIGLLVWAIATISTRRRKHRP